jgi:hypothetical protein
LLSELADRTGLTLAMSEAMDGCGISWHTHDPGVVLTHLAVAIADSADCLSDLAALREDTELFGPVASHPVHVASPAGDDFARAARDSKGSRRRAEEGLGRIVSGQLAHLGLRRDAAHLVLRQTGRRPLLLLTELRVTDTGGIASDERLSWLTVPIRD